MTLGSIFETARHFMPLLVGVIGIVVILFSLRFGGFKERKEEEEFWKNLDKI